MQFLEYPGDLEEINSYLQERNLAFQDELNRKVSGIIEDVQNEGDKALKKYTEKFDGVELDDLQVPEEKMQNVSIDGELERALIRTRDRLQDYYRSQLEKSWIHPHLSGEVGEKKTALKSAGIYIPGGRAAYPSSVFMTAVPASVAGVRRIAAVTPPGEEGSINPVTARALQLCGVEEVYRLGGAQAVAALALGTDSVPAVDKIVGPGNRYVTMAKKLVYGLVDIDMLAGPSEVMIIADGSAESSFLAADLLAQAEHDPEAKCVVVSTSSSLAGELEDGLNEQLQDLKTAERARKALEEYGLFVGVDCLEQAVDLANKFAPEHLELLTECPGELVRDVENAGSIFLGSYSPEAAGDYMAGPNHVLPTAGTARFFSPLSVRDFIKSSGRMQLQEEELRELGPDIMKIARAEDLPAHARSIQVRLEG